MALVSLTTLLARARERADMVNSDFITDAKFTDFINEGWQILYEKLLAAYESNYFEKQSTITLVGGTSDYALPADFFKLYGIDWNGGPMGQVLTLKPYMRAERNFFRNSALFFTTPYLKPRYMLTQDTTGANQTVRLLPSTATGTITVFYAPIAPLLDSAVPAGTISVLNGWERFIVIYAAIQALMKEESSTTALEAERQKMEAQLTELAENRDMGMPMEAVDSELADDFFF